MRKSVKIKNFIAVAMMICGILMILGAGSSVDLPDYSFKQLTISALSGMCFLIIGYFVREW